MESSLCPHVSTAFLGSAGPDTWMSFQLHLRPLSSLWSCPESLTRPLISPTFCSWKPLTATINLIEWVKDGAEYKCFFHCFCNSSFITLPRKGNWDIDSTQLARNTTKQLLATQKLPGKLPFSVFCDPQKNKIKSEILKYGRNLLKSFSVSLTRKKNKNEWFCKAFQYGS